MVIEVVKRYSNISTNGICLCISMRFFRKRKNTSSISSNENPVTMGVEVSQKIDQPSAPKGSKHSPKYLLFLIGGLIILALVGYVVYFSFIRRDWDSSPPVDEAQQNIQDNEKIEPHQLGPLTPEEQAAQDEYDKSTPSSSSENKGSTDVYLLPPEEANQEAPKATGAAQGPTQ